MGRRRVRQNCLDEEEYPETCGHPEARTLEASGLHVLDQLFVALALRGKFPAEDPAATARRLQRRYQQTLKQLTAAGVKTRRDTDEGWEIYRARREKWEMKLYALSNHLGYDWDEVTGDRNLRVAADEEAADSRP